jgi:hypothetical protein
MEQKDMKTLDQFELPGAPWSNFFADANCALALTPLRATATAPLIQGPFATPQAGQAKRRAVLAGWPGQSRWSSVHESFNEGKSSPTGCYSVYIGIAAAVQCSIEHRSTLLPRPHLSDFDDNGLDIDSVSFAASSTYPRSGSEATLEMSLLSSQLPRAFTSARRIPQSIYKMPLRAKITSGPMAQTRYYTPAAVTLEAVQEQIKQDPENDPNDILLSKEHGARIITLNRPTKLNSLNASMARKLLLRLKVRLFASECEY